MGRNRLRIGLTVAIGTLLLMGAAIPLLRTGPLSGRTIVIDPGHGGPRDTGAVGSGGLTEKAVNLEVALRVGDQLRRLGARVILTRTTDTAVSAADDLRARAEVANEAKADLFLSIHHNDTTVVSDPRNETQVYWRLEDDGPSRDAAALLLPSLAAALHQPRRRLIPGNFAVLRHCRRPAVLGEGAYLTNPPSAAMLATPGGWQAEADAYAGAIQRYFGRGIPMLGPVAADPGGRIRIPVTTDGAPIQGVRLWIDGLPVHAQYRPETAQIRWQPPTPMANGPHRLKALVRNRRGNAGLPLETVVTVDRPAASLTAAAVPPVWNPVLTAQVLLTARVLDGSGLPVADGTAVRFAVGGLQAMAVTRAGKAGAFVPWSGSVPLPGTVTVGRVSGTVAFRDGPSPPQLVVSVSGASSAEVPAAAVRLGGIPRGHVDGDGRLVLTPAPGRYDLSVTARGYEPWHAPVEAAGNRVVTARVTLIPKYGGVLLGRHVMLDPGAAAGAPGAGLRNLAVVRRLQTLLQDAGSVTVLSRQAGRPAEMPDRVRQAGRFGAELYVGIGDGDGTAAHYYASGSGARLAGLLHEQPLGLSPAPEATYLLSHTACPAVIVRASLQGPDALADAVFVALRRYFAEPVAKR